MLINVIILLLLIFVLSFWLLVDSKVSTKLKILCISLFFAFVCVFIITTDSILGWAAKPSLMPEVISIKAVIIKEPNKKIGSEGSIHILIESEPIRYDGILLKLFGHKVDSYEPRLFRLPYSRSLHEKLQSEVMDKTSRGQIVRGKLVKIDNDNLGGSHSLEQEWMFYDLRPSYENPKH